MANTFNHNDKVVITDGGSVGIGTTSPSSKLHIAGSDGSWDRHLTLEYDASNVVKIVGDTDGLKLRTMNSGKGFYFRNSANSTNLIITDGGNVGIGTTSPAQRFHVNSGTDNIAALFQSTDQSVSILFDDSLKVTEINSNNGQFIFSVNGTSGGATATEAMRIDRDGNVGIGTTSPSSKLHSKGEIRVDYNNTDGSTYFTGYGVEFDRGTCYLRPRSADGTQTLYIGNANDALDWNKVSFKVSNEFSVRSGGIDTFIINSSGNVGIGTTSPSYTLDVSGTQRVTGNVVFEGQISFPGVNGNNFVIDTDEQRIVWDHQRNGTRKMVFYHETDADTFNFSFTSGNNLQINGNRIVTANELGTAAASAATDFVAVSGDTMSGDLNMGSNDIKAVNSIVLNNVEGSLFGTVNGTLIFDENFYGDTEYGTAWAGGNGGGLAIYGEDGWNRMLSDKNAQWFLGTAAFSRSDDFVAVTGDTMSGNLTISNSSPDLFFETGATHYNWMVAAQENVNAGFEISVGSQDADSSNDTWSPKLVILQSGNVGIGTTSPSQKLHIVGGDSNQLLLENGTSSGNARILFKANSNRNAGPFIQATQRGGAASDSDLQLGDESGTTVTINAGNVGIGTTSPAFKLDVVTGGDASVMRLLGSAGNQTYFGFDGGGGYIETNGASTARQKLRFQSYNGSAYTQLFIDGGNQYIYTSSNVNVGIGTTSPITKLHVYGDIAVGGDNSDAILRFIEGTDGWTIRHVAIGNRLAMSNVLGGTDHFNITETGSVGIGTTSPSDKLHVAGSVKITTGDVNLDAGRAITFYGNSNTNHSISSTNNTGGSADDIRINSYGAIYFNLDSNNNNTSGADFKIARHGGTSTLSDYLFTLSGETGNVGIGTTAPSTKLYVDGGESTFNRGNSDGAIARFRGKNAEKAVIGTVDSWFASNVGIGTTSPAYKLDVSGDIRATETVISGGQQLVIPAVGRFLFDSSTDYNTSTEGSVAISTEGAIQGGDNTVYTINERDITFNESGFYKISVYITYTSTVQRANPGIRLKKNGTDYISPWGLSGYLRYASGHNEASNFVDTIAYFDEGDYVEVYRMAFAASGTCTDDGSGSHILIERIAM